MQEIGTTDLKTRCSMVTKGWNNAAMMCFHELDVPNSLRMCLRILVVVNCDTSFVPKFVYLKGASTLRSK